MPIPPREEPARNDAAISASGSARAARMRDRLHPVAVDAAAACFYALVFLSPDRIGGQYRGWAVAFTLATVVLPLALRRVRPKSVFVVVFIGNAAGLIAGAVRDPMLAAALALYPVAVGTSPDWRGRPPWWTFAWGGTVLAAFTAGGPSPAVPSLAASTVALGGAWILGRAVADRRAQTARALRESALRAVAEERMHMARELHDVVSGTLNAVLVQASVGGHVARQRPDQAVQALEAIESASRDGMADMRRMLDVLTDQGTGAGGSPAVGESLAERLDRAVERARDAGVDVSFAPETVPEGLEPTADLAVQRLVQEALTNTVRHAGPTECRVDVEADGDRVRVEIADAGPKAAGAAAAPEPSGAPRSSGRGLRGMRERVEAAGGTLQACSDPGGGFRVEARLPVRLPHGGAPAETGR